MCDSSQIAHRRARPFLLLTASISLRRMRDLGLLESKGKSSQTYYILGKIIEFREAVTPHVSNLAVEITPQMGALPSELNPVPSELNSLPSELLRLPSDLQYEVIHLGLRTPKIGSENRK